MLALSMSYCVSECLISGNVENIISPLVSHLDHANRRLQRLLFWSEMFCYLLHYVLDMYNEFVVYDLGRDSHQNIIHCFCAVPDMIQWCTKPSMSRS